MEKILFIGDPNVINNDLIHDLRTRYELMVFMGDLDALGDSIRSKKPDLIFVSLLERTQNYLKIFSYLGIYHNTIKVLVLGDDAAHEEYERHYAPDHIEKVVWPISVDSIVQICEEKIFVTADGTKKKHILIVDDNAMILRSIKKLLDEEYVVSVAASGAQAFISIGKRRPDLILLDYDMPVMDGKTFLESIRADGQLADIPVIFLTGVARQDVVTTLLQLKPAGYILKPPEKKSLLQKIRLVLER